METKKKHELSLAKRMAISLVCGLVAGLAFMFLREHLNASGQAQTWTTINNLLFQDITAEGAERAFGIFYIIGQLFIKALQLVIIPMVFTSISLAIGSIADTRTMGRISAKTLFWFLLCSFLALLLAGCVGYGTYSMGLFNTRIEGLAEASGSTGSNPLNVVLNIIPSNIITAFGSNGAVLSSVFLAVAIGLSMNTLGESRTATLRRLLGEKKIGHGGTLDPMATGLLMLVVGKATKLQDKLMCEHKEYAGTLMLGVETSSQDAMGEIVAEYSVDGVTEKAVREAFDRFDGAFEQIPPMVSAIKKGGVPLYKLARKGQEVVREPRPVEVFGHGISRVAIPEVDFTVQCSKGFYVRSYAYDIGKALGCGAHLSALRRTRSGSFTLDRAITVDTLKTAPREELFRAMLSLKELADILIAG